MPLPVFTAETTKTAIIRLVWIASAVIVLDQVTKAMVLSQLPLYHSVPVLPGFFNLTHVQNPGGAFGFLAGQSPALRAVVFLAASAMAALLVLYFYMTTPPTHRFLAVGFALIFSGAIGNLIDRVRFGVVVDFLDFFVGKAHWPAFNVADSAITVGMTIFAGHLVFRKLPEAHTGGK
ncbi:MAG: signal peptidase II [Pseudomonadota bacterium]